MRVAITSLIVALAGLQPQSPPDIDTLVSRLGAYLLEYEPQLSTIIAQELYRQSVTRPRAGQTSLEGGIGSVTTRTLESEVAFLRLPGNLAWYGVRDVRVVDGQQVAASGPRLLDAIRASSGDRDTLIQVIVRASSAHNLGPSRTINMPTVPLELLHPRNRLRFSFRLAGTATISAASTREIRFQELATPALVQDSAGRGLLSAGSAWIEPASGRLWRVVVRFEPVSQTVQSAQAATNEFRIDFANNATLGLLVPAELRENIELGGGGHLQGRATYSDFRRFTTSARIIPPP